MFQRLQRSGWPYSQPPNVAFDPNLGSPQKRGIVAWWPTLASPGARILPELMRGFDGALQAGVGWKENAQLGAGLTRIGAANDHVVLPASAPWVLDLAQAWSFSCWFRVTNLGAWQCLLGVTEDAGNYLVVYAGGINNDEIEATWDTGFDAVTKSSNTTFGAGTIYHLLVTWDPGQANAARWTIYLNGQDAGSNVTAAGAGAGAFAPNNARFMNNAIWDEPLIGEMWDGRYYNALLYEQDAAAMYASMTRWEFYRPRIRRLWAMAPAAPAVGQPMMLRGTTVPGLRQWHPRV